MSQLLTSLAVAALLALGASQDAAPTAPGAEKSADAPAAPRASLDPIKKLVGTWVAVENGKPTDQVVTEFRLTAGGSAVLETIFPGTDHEMITLYYVDGPELMLTHYCVMGNQPTMKAKRGTPANQLVFECQGGSNIGPDDAHMHEGSYEFIDADRMKTRWIAVQKGETIHQAEFELARRSKPAAAR